MEAAEAAEPPPFSEEELLEQLKELGYDLPEASFTYSEGVYTISDQDNAKWTEFLDNLKIVNKDLYNKINNGTIDAPDWETLDKITKSDWDEAIAAADAPDDRWYENFMDGSGVEDVIPTLNANAEQNGAVDDVAVWIAIGIVGGLLLLGGLVLLLCYCRKNRSTQARGGIPLMQDYNSNTDRDHHRDLVPLLPGGYNHGRRLIHTPIEDLARELDIKSHVSRPLQRRRVLRGTHAPFADLAIELGISPKSELHHHSRNLAAEVEPPLYSVVQEVCESTGFTQKDLIWIIPLSCVTQAFWIYVGYKLYKRCRRNRNNNDRSRNQRAT